VFLLKELRQPGQGCHSDTRAGAA